MKKCSKCKIDIAKLLGYNNEIGNRDKSKTYI